MSTPIESINSDNAEPRRIIIDAVGPFLLTFTKRDGYGIEIDGQRLRVEHLRAAVEAYDAAVGGGGDE